MRYAQPTSPQPTYPHAMHHADLKWKVHGKYGAKITLAIRNTVTGEAVSCCLGVNLVRLSDTIDELGVLLMAIERSKVLRPSFISPLMLAVQYFVIQTREGHECLEYRTEVWGWAQVTGGSSR